MRLEAYEELEERWAQFIEMQPSQVVVCSSGSAALQLAVAALSARANPTALCPDYTFIAALRALTSNGISSIVMVDCDASLNMCPEAVEVAVQNLHAHIALPTHIYGRRVSEAAMTLLRRHCSVVIEDCAEFHGADITESESDAWCWSFYKNKVIAGEEGGAVAFRHEQAAQRARKLRSHGMGPEYICSERGFHARLSNANATLILQNLEKYEQNLAARRALERKYDECTPSRMKRGFRDVPWVYDVELGAGDLRSAIIESMQCRGIAARPGFHRLHKQPETRGKLPLISVRDMEHKTQNVMYMPLDPYLSEEDVRRATSVLHSYIF